MRRIRVALDRQLTLRQTQYYFGNVNTCAAVSPLASTVQVQLHQRANIKYKLAFNEQLCNHVIQMIQ